MKIGLISINAHTKVLNAASPLHTYVFQQFLLQNGIESTIIDYKPVYYGNFDVRHPLFYYVDHPDKDAKKQKALLKKWKDLFYERERRFDRLEEFVDKYYVKTDKCYSAQILENEDSGFDCYICVTDIIWKYNPNTGFDKGYILACKSMEGKGKIAYSASRGAKGYTYAQEKEFLEYISDFDHISVREKSLQKYIEDISGLKTPHVLDPVFLQKKEFYHELAMEPEEKDFVLIYIVMEKSKKLVEQAVRYAEARGMEVIELSEDLENQNIPKGTTHRVIYDIGVEEWLGYMKRSKAIFTNSFHACCFSMILNIPFFVGARAGDKIDSVLEMFDLSWRRITDEPLDMILNMPDIDFEKVTQKIDKYAEESKAYILGAIKDVESRGHKPLITKEECEQLQKKADDRKAQAEAKQTEAKQAEMKQMEKKQSETKQSELKPSDGNRASAQKSRWHHIFTAVSRLFKS